MNGSLIVKNEENPSAYRVALVLCIASVVFGLLMFAIEFVLDKELSTTGLLSTIIPAMISGQYFGYKSGAIMSSSTRWYALLLWLLVSVVLAVLISFFFDLSLSDIFYELGWLNLALVVVLTITMVVAYFIFRFGEKLGVKSMERSKAKT